MRQVIVIGSMLLFTATIAFSQDDSVILFDNNEHNQSDMVLYGNALKMPAIIL